MNKVVLIGSISVGKSTVLSEFQKQFPSIKIVEEPVEIWEKFPMNNQKYFNLFQYGTENFKNLMNFQVGAFASFIDICRGKGAYRNVLHERCLISGQKIFIPTAKKLNVDCISEEEIAIFDYLVATVTKMDPYLLCFDSIIYLRANINSQMDRIHKRNRKGEEWISKQYLEMLDEAYCKWSSENFLPLKFNRKYEIFTDNKSPEEVAQLVYDYCFRD